MFGLIIIFCLQLFYLQPIYAVDVEKNLVRVLISDTKSGRYDHTSLAITSAEEYFVFDGQNFLFKSEPDKTTNITVDNDFILFANAGKIYKVLKANKVFINSKQPLSVASLCKKSKPALYAGLLELSINNTNKLKLINILDVEEYLKGVVPNEMPVYFGLEALKAQAVAARGYVFRENTDQNRDYDVSDTTSSQVYFGKNTHDELSDRAVDETKGQFALYNGDIILSLYSSTAGGHTENYENVFSTSNGKKIKYPSDPISYLKGVKDTKGDYDLSDETLARVFWENKVKTYDIDSPLYRWDYTWGKDELENILKKTLKQQSSSGFVKPKLENEADFGEILDISVLKRGVSGKAMYVKIETTKGIWYIAKEITIRKIFQYNNKWLPSGNVFFDIKSDDTGKITDIRAFGGGFGHGVGLSQYGAGYMAKHGFKYDDILKHYYTGIAIGTFPLVCHLKSNAVCGVSFYDPQPKGNLIVEYSFIAHDTLFEINGKELKISANEFSNKKAKVNVEDYLIKGQNQINLVKNNQRLFELSPNNVKFYVEISGSSDEK